MSAVLLFVDGRTRRVKYSQAAEIKLVMMGQKKAKDKKQRDFISTIKSLEFDQAAIIAPPQIGQPVSISKDDEINNIVNDPSLTGREKARAVVNRLRNRPKNFAHQQGR